MSEMNTMFVGYLVALPVSICHGGWIPYKKGNDFSPFLTYFCISQTKIFTSLQIPVRKFLNYYYRYLTLSHFKNECDVTAYFMSGRFKTCMLFSVCGEVRKSVTKMQAKCNKCIVATCYDITSILKVGQSLGLTL